MYSISFKKQFIVFLFALSRGGETNFYSLQRKQLPSTLLLHKWCLGSGTGSSTCTWLLHFLAISLLSNIEILPAHFLQDSSVPELTGSWNALKTVRYQVCVTCPSAWHEGTRTAPEKRPLQEGTKHGMTSIHITCLVDFREKYHSHCATVSSPRKLWKVTWEWIGSSVVWAVRESGSWHCRGGCACTISLACAVPAQMMPGSPEHPVICDSVKPDQLGNLKVIWCHYGF